LEVIAADAVDVVKHTGRRAVIEGLSSAERRKIHAAATLDDAVETRSEGEGDFRFLMVSRRS
jgi:predicted RNA-binding protein Jag